MRFLQKNQIKLKDKCPNDLHQFNRFAAGNIGDDFAVYSCQVLYTAMPEESDGDFREIFVIQMQRQADSLLSIRFLARRLR